MNAAPILQTVDLKKHYQQGEHITKALDGVNLSVNAGEFVAIVGTSGSGKSTLLHMMGGLDTPTSGDVIISGKKLSNKSEEQMAIFRRRHIGFVFQNYNLIPILNVYENIVLPVQLDGRRVLSFPMRSSALCGRAHFVVLSAFLSAVAPRRCPICC